MILALAGQFTQQVRGSYLHLISNTALHITLLSYKVKVFATQSPLNAIARSLSLSLSLSNNVA